MEAQADKPLQQQRKPWSGNPPSPGDYLLFACSEHTNKLTGKQAASTAYPTHGMPLATLLSWLPDGCTQWAIAWAPSRTAAIKAAAINWEQI